MDTFNRTGTYHKPSKTGRAWYVFVRGDQPQNNEPCNVLRKNGNIDSVTLFDCVMHNDGWLCKFRHVGQPKPEAPQVPPPSINPMDFMGGPQDEAKAEAQAKVEIDISATLELARKTLQADAEGLSRGLEAEVEGAIREAMARVSGRIEVIRVDGTVHDAGRQHFKFGELLRYTSLGFHCWVPGPAGSGKTTAAEMVARALGLPFYCQPKVMFEHSLMGYKDAQGVYQRTIFRQAWEHGGVFLLDECDSSEAKALLAINMIEQGEMAFPDGMVKKHADFRLIAAANTYGLGGDADYVGRNKLDAAFLDRFVTVDWPYDEEFETLLAGNAEWTGRVQGLRRNAKAKGIKVVITPRASIKGARALAAGVSQAQVERDFIRKGMTDQQWSAIQ